MPGKAWRLDHDPYARPLGCNGKYGKSGVHAHKVAGTEPCHECRESFRHYSREYRRGQPLGRHLKPCGTPAAFLRHKRRGEEPCFPCRLAEAKRKTEYKARKRRERRELALAA